MQTNHGILKCGFPFTSTSNAGIILGFQFPMRETELVFQLNLDQGWVNTWARGPHGEFWWSVLTQPVTSSPLQQIAKSPYGAVGGRGAVFRIGRGGWGWDHGVGLLGGNSSRLGPEACSLHTYPWGSSFDSTLNFLSEKRWVIQICYKHSTCDLELVIPLSWHWQD